MDENKNSNLLVAVSVVIAGALIAGAVIFTKDSSVATDLTAQYSQFMRKYNSQFNAIRPETTTADPNRIPAPNAGDRIVGNPDAPVIIVEYSDTECPFCAVLHRTLKEVVAEYNGQVAWVYRHLPLPTLHQKAIIEAHAMECAGELAGNEGFWNFTNAIYDTTPSNDKFDLNQLPIIAEEIGLDVAEFNKCMEEERHISAIEADYRDALNATAGRVGTPFNVVFTKDGQRIVASGALPKNTGETNWKKIIDGLLNISAPAAETTPSTN